LLILKMTTTSAATTPPSPFRSDCLTGQVALITGGGSGIGFEIARQILRHGAHGVLICGRRASFLTRAVHMLQQEHPQTQVAYAVCDVRNPEQCQAAVATCQSKWQRLDILVNGAAGNFLAAAHQLSPKGFATVMAIDALGTFNMCHAAHALLSHSATHAPSSSQQHTTVIVNISATLQYGATWWQAHASAAKSAVDSLTRSLALEWGSDRIRVVGIAPGPIADTPGTTKLAPVTGSMDSLVEEGIPLGRMGQASEIGAAVVYLCTAQYVTGDTLVVDGGQWLYRPPMIPKELVSELSRQVEQTSRNQAPTAKL
jgi:2,4-dienoyl-CoA reductase [(3E)-enoyl-CoA-producing], peroxisomal